MRVLLLGSGAKDHAIAWWFSQSRFISALYVAPGNLATASIAENLPDLDPTDKEAVYSACQKLSIDFVFIGTEAPLFTGVIKYLNERGISTFGATEEATKLEGDKIFSRAFFARHRVPCPVSAFFKTLRDLDTHLQERKGQTFVIKSSRVAPSRIMLTSSDRHALLDFASSLFPMGPVLLEENLTGISASCTLFLDGDHYILLPITGDYTTKGTDDTTPTGGMGAICPVPVIEKLKNKIVKNIIEPVLEGMKQENLMYKGVLTLSLVITTDGPYLVDIHVRFNDPATQAMVPLITTDLVDIMNAMKEGRLNEIELQTSQQIALAVVLASEGYPLAPVTGREIKGLTCPFLLPLKDHPVIFCGAMQRAEHAAVTTGGRNITVVGVADTLSEANRKAYEVIKQKNFEGLWYREDIGNSYLTI